MAWFLACSKSHEVLFDTFQGSSAVCHPSWCRLVSFHCPLLVLCTVLCPFFSPLFPFFFAIWLLQKTAYGSPLTFLSPAEVACRGERVRDVYQRQQGYAACQTQEKVSRLECRGSCPGGAEGQGTCCTPLRSKRRKYTFQCTDGSSFVQEVEKVVKCGCTKCSS